MKKDYVERKPVVLTEDGPLPNGRVRSPHEEDPEGYTCMPSVSTSLSWVANALPEIDYDPADYVAHKFDLEWTLFGAALLVADWSRIRQFLISGTALRHWWAHFPRTSEPSSHMCLALANSTTTFCNGVRVSRWAKQSGEGRHTSNETPMSVGRAVWKLRFPPSCYR